MKTRPRRWLLARIAIALAIVLPLTTWLATLQGGVILGAGPRGEGCRSFWGESVASVAWSPAGGFLVVGTEGTGEPDSGDSAVRVFRWPGMQVVSHSKQVPGTTEIAIDDAGVLTWSVDGVRDSSAIVPTPTIAWQLDPGGVAKTADGASTGTTKVLRANTDTSALGIVAEASAPASERPNQLCVRDGSAAN
jgi:hypothetical protein